MGLVVRESKKSDYPHIRALLDGLDGRDRRFLALDYKRQAVMNAARKGRHCYVADSDGDIVGFMRESGRPGGASHLEELVVHPKMRGNGVATMMMSSYHSQFPKTTAKTKPYNGPMKRLLERHGYSVVDPDARNVLLWERG